MFSVFKQTIGAATDQVFEDRAAFGLTTIERKVRVAAEFGSGPVQRVFLTRERYTALGDVKVELGGVVNDPRGLNARIIGESGYVEPEIFNGFTRTLVGLAREARPMIEADPGRIVRAESQIALLVGLISSFYVATAKRAKLEPKMADYNDGHVRLKLAEWVAGPPPENVNVLRAFRVGSMWRPADYGMVMAKPHVHTSGLDLRAARVLVAHLGGRQRTTQWSFDLDIPELCGDFARSGNMNDGEAPPSEDDLSDPELLWRTLETYVITNRLQSQLETAVMVYMQTALRPIPDTAEGLIWLARKRTLRLPAFDTFRGYHPALVSELPFGFTAAIHNVHNWWRTARLSLAVQGGIFTAVSLWGRYMVESNIYDENASARHFIGDLPTDSVPGLAWVAYASVVTGAKLICSASRHVGLAYEPWDAHFEYRLPLAAAVTRQPGYSLGLPTQGAPFGELIVTALPEPAPLSAVLGRAPELAPVRALQPHFEVTVSRVTDKWFVDGPGGAWAYGLLHRVFGYDVDFSWEGKRGRGNWAPNETSLAARPFPEAQLEDVAVRVVGVAARTKTWASLPGLPPHSHTFRVDVEVGDLLAGVSTDAGRIFATGAVAFADSFATTVKVNHAAVDYVAVSVQMGLGGRAGPQDFQVSWHLERGVPPAGSTQGLHSNAPDEVMPDEPPG